MLAGHEHTDLGRFDPHDKRGRHLNKFGEKICDYLPLVGDNPRNFDRRCVHGKAPSPDQPSQIYCIPITLSWLPPVATAGHSRSCSERLPPT
jgi:hypothetical protein